MLKIIEINKSKSLKDLKSNRYHNSLSTKWISHQKDYISTSNAPSLSMSNGHKEGNMIW